LAYHGLVERLEGLIMVGPGLFRVWLEEDEAIVGPFVERVEFSGGLADG
jgi:hypothetical protein